MYLLVISEAFCIQFRETQPSSCPFFGKASFKLRAISEGTPSAAANSAALEVLKPSVENVNNELHRLLQEQESTLISVEGFISKRRALSSSLVFIDIIFCEDNESMPPLQALLRREFFDDSASFKAYHKVLQPGIRLSVVGHVGPSRNPGEVLLFIHEAIFLAPNSNPQHMKNVLRLVHSGDLPLEEFGPALNMLPQELQHMLQEKGDRDDGYYNKMGHQILSNMTDLLDPSKLMGSSNTAKISMLPPIPSNLVSPPKEILKLAAKASDDFEDSFETVTIQQVFNAIKSSVSADDTDISEITPVKISAWVRNRRRFKDSVTVIEMVDEYSAQDEEELEDGNIKLSADMSRLKSILHPTIMTQANHLSTVSEVSERKAAIKPIDMYGGLLCAGSRVTLQGFLVRRSSENNEGGLASLWVTSARLLRSSWRPKVVRQMMELIKSSAIDIEEASEALELPGGIYEAEEIAETKLLTERQWKAAEISGRLQDESSRLGKVTPEMERVLELSEKWRIQYPLPDETSLKENGTAYFEEKSIGTQVKKSFEGSRWQRKKRPQLDWMIEQIEEVIARHPGRRPLRVVDVGGGKGYLAGLIAEYFGSDIVDVRVVDICSRAVKNGMMRAQRRNLGNIQFTAGDAQVDVPLDGVDIVVALHACGALSDVAIGHAITNGAAFVVCPCCFRSNPHLRVKIPATCADMQLGEDPLVAVSEWLDVDSKVYETLKEIAEIQGDVNLAGKAMHAICALRAKAAEGKSEQYFEKNRSVRSLEVELRRFPIGLSTRNMCIIGKLSEKEKHRLCEPNNT
mmetsp:Transcript_10966/g.15453  ORF Transcript_10966/g.15453 Transcript_10966/m.15453 type:complete len:800 (-) Transcript_10966:240-2639(-)